MKTIPIKSLIVGVGLMIAPLSGSCQGFMNLNFEAAKIIPLMGGPYPNSIATSNALPGWTVFYGPIQQSVVTYNSPALGSTFVTLWATNDSQLAGNFSVLLQGGLTAAAALISQTGLVPADARSILFYGAGSSSTTPVLAVSLGGQDLPIAALSAGPSYTVYGADVSAFAGQTETLIFSALRAPSGFNDWNIDNIQFSNQYIPEPSRLVIFGLGVLFLSRWRRL